MSASPAKPVAHVAIVVERPVDVVRAQFFDLDQHVREGLHHGATMRWTIRPPGERRIKQETRVLGRVVAEEFVVEEETGGRWVKRFVEGPNAGGRYVVSFAASGPDATRLDAEAFAPPKGFDNGLGKLSDLGVQKALDRILADHRRALEGYEPGRLRGDVGAVLDALGELTGAARARDAAEQRTILATFLEAASLVAVADEVADAFEQQAMKAAARRLFHVDVEDASLDRMVKGTADAAKAEGFEARCDKIGARLRKLAVGQLGLAVATLIAEVTHGVETRELAALRRLASAAGVPEVELGQMVSRIDGLLTTAPRA